MHNEFHDLCITKVYSDDQITDGDMGEPCRMDGGEEKCTQLGRINWQERDRLENLGIDRQLVLK